MRRSRLFPLLFPSSPCRPLPRPMPACRPGPSWPRVALHSEAGDPRRAEAAFLRRGDRLLPALPGQSLHRSGPRAGVEAIRRARADGHRGRRIELADKNRRFTERMDEQAASAPQKPSSAGTEAKNRPKARPACASCPRRTPSAEARAGRQDPRHAGGRGAPPPRGPTRPAAAPMRLPPPPSAPSRPGATAEDYDEGPQGRREKEPSREPKTKRRRLASLATRCALRPVARPAFGLPARGKPTDGPLSRPAGGIRRPPTPRRSWRSA